MCRHSGPVPGTGQIAYETGKRIVDMVWETKPSDILTRKAREPIVAASALGASTNCPPHITRSPAISA